jgi:chorismate mutase
MNNEILELRKKIDKLDKDVLDLLEERFEITHRIGEIKRTEEFQIRDHTREDEMMGSRINQTELNENFVAKLFSTILEESRRLQSK